MCRSSGSESTPNHRRRAVASGCGGTCGGLGRRRRRALWLGAAIAVLLLPGVSLLLALAARRGVRLSLTLTPTVPKHAAAQAVLLVKNDALLSARALFRVRAVNALTREETVTLLRCTVPPKGHGGAALSRGEPPLRSDHRGGGKGRPSRYMRHFCRTIENGKHRRAHDRPAGHVRARDQSCARLLHAGGERQLRARLPRERSHGDLPAARIRPGDDLRRIHWKMTAKTDRLIVREASLPLQRSLLVFWDKTAADKLAPDAADALAESVSSVCQSLSEAGFAYTLGWSGEGQNVLEEVPDTDRLLALLPRMVRSAGAGESGTAQLVRQGGENFTAACCSSRTPCRRRSKALAERCALTLLLCSRAETASPCRTVRFTPGTMRSVCMIWSLWNEKNIRPALFSACSAPPRRRGERRSFPRCSRRRFSRSVSRRLRRRCSRPA